MDGNYRFRCLACLCDAVLYGLLQEIGVHIPCPWLAVHEDRGRTLIGDWIGGCRESETLADHLIAL